MTGVASASAHTGRRRTKAGAPIPSGWEMKRIDTFGTAGSVPDVTTLHSLYNEGQFYNVNAEGLVKIPNVVINHEQGTYRHFEDVIAFSSDHITIQARGQPDNSINTGELVSKYFARSFIFEGRIQVPSTGGSWAAFWVFGRATGNDSSEFDNEFSMTFGQEADVQHEFTLFNHPQESNIVISDSRFTTTFYEFFDSSLNVTTSPHNYTVIYDDVAGKITRYFDGKLVYTADFKWNSSLGGTGFGPDACLIANLATGGDFPGQISSPSTYSGDMLIYWIGYYAPVSWTPPVPVQNWGSDRNAHIILSGSNLIATAGSNGVDQAVFGSVGVDIGKYYWEIVLNHNGNGGAGIGNLTTVVADGDYLGSTDTSIGWYDGGGVFCVGSQIATWATFSTGVVRLCFALDLTNNKLWGRVGTTGNWNNAAIGSQNPATNTGGLDLTAAGNVLNNPLAPGANLKSTTIPDAATGVFVSASWLGTPPSGFGQFVT
jgi:hypothetical protein